MISEILNFLPCETKKEWLQCAKDNIRLLLVDHANCEKKAASSALHMTYRYVDKPNILIKFSRLAREEMHHFEQVVAIMVDRKVTYSQLSASRYAAGLKKVVRAEEPGRLVDTLLIGAIIEARSCERFSALVPVLDERLSSFYSSLLKSESRHFLEYLELAESEASGDEIQERLEILLAEEKQLIESKDRVFRFHSGEPCDNLNSDYF